MAEPLFGLETEYAVAALTGHQAASQRDTAMGLLALARQNLPSLPDYHANGLFLQNGSRLYIDAGHHPEISTPECSTPWDAVRYVAAGHHIIEGLGRRLAAQRPSLTEILLSRINVCYENCATWGCHESYLHRSLPDALGHQLLPHLVSRTIFTGAGGFNTEQAGLSFLVSPRAPHLARERSSDSTHDRGILHTKDEPLASDGYHRLHLICGESLCSHLAQWLKVGTTAIVIAMIEQGLTPSRTLDLSSSVTALHTFARDPSCTATVPTKFGVRLSAIAIQRQYLAMAEAHAGAAFMPRWTALVCREWRAILDRLAQGPGAVSTTLDWAIKLSLFKHHAARRGFSWDAVGTWSHVVHGMTAALRAQEIPSGALHDEALLGPHSPVPAAVKFWTTFLTHRNLDWSPFRPFLTLRAQLRELDARFSQLGPRGLFSKLDANGVLSHAAPGVEDIEAAIDTAPASGRAHVRGAAIKELFGSRTKGAADWSRVHDFKNQRHLDLGHPFTDRMEWLPTPTGDDLLDPLEGLLSRAAQIVRGARSR